MSGPCNTYELNQAFLDALEFMDRVIKDRSHRKKRLYFDLIPRGAYPLGEGLVRKMHKFHGSVNDQAALEQWRSIQISRAASGDDPGYDSCRYESDMIDYAFETIQYTGYETTKRSKDICLNDIKWKWEFKQQLKLIFGFLADVTLQIWENYGREMYLKMCADQSQIFVCVRGAPNTSPLTTDYNPFTSDEMTITRDVDIAQLDWSYLDWWYEYMNIQAPQAALGNDGGMPSYGLVIHAKDFDDMIRGDADIREDFRYAKSMVLIDQYGKVKSYKGYAIIHDEMAPRFRSKSGSMTATTITLQRVLPFASESTTIGSKYKINPDYLNAEYAIGVIFIKDVFEIMVPPSGPTSPGGGTQFGAVPSLNGEFHWLNIIDRCENPLGEKGYYFSRFQAFAKPGDHHDNAVAFIYKRCPQVNVRKCDPCDTTSDDWTVANAAVPILEEGETATSHTKVKLTLASCLDCEAPSELYVDYDGTGGSDITGVVIDDSEAPIYKVQFATAADYVDAATIVAGTTTVKCA